MKVLAIFVALCLMLSTACSKAPDSNAVEAHTHRKPSLDVQLDVAGNQVTVKVNTDISISAEHYGLARQEGEGHIHMYLDDGEKIGVKQGRQVFNNLKPGSHTLRVSLHNNDHTPYDVTKTIEFEIRYPAQ